MHLRSGKSMARASSSSSQAQPLQATSPLGDLNVSTHVEATMAMPGSAEMRVTSPSTVSTSTQMRRSKMGTVIPPFTVGVPSTTSMLSTSAPSNRPRLDD